MTETGHQPWVVYNVMRTADGLSPSLHTNEVAVSPAVVFVIYMILLVSFLYYLAKLIGKRPDLDEPLPHQDWLDTRLAAPGD